MIGRILYLRLQPAVQSIWLGPAFATLCGILSTGIIPQRVDGLVKVLLAIFLADAVFGGVWQALLHLQQGIPKANLAISDSVQSLDGRKAGQQSVRTLRVSSSTRQPAHPRLGEQRPSMAPTAPPGPADPGHPPATHRPRQLFVEVGLVYVLALVLGFVLGQGVTLVVGLGLFLPWLIAFAMGGEALYAHSTRTVLDFVLPWVIGVAAFTTFPAVDWSASPSGWMPAILLWAQNYRLPLIMGLAFGIACYGILGMHRPRYWISRPLLVNLPQLAMVGLLVSWQRPLLAGLAAILVFAQALFQPYAQFARSPWYVTQTQWMFMGVMLLTVLGAIVNQSM